MNPFLVGLIDRAAQRAPVLERRQRSLFEPAAPGPDAPAERIETVPARPREPEASEAAPRTVHHSEPLRREPATGSFDRDMRPMSREPVSPRPFESSPPRTRTEEPHALQLERARANVPALREKALPAPQLQPQPVPTARRTSPALPHGPVTPEPVRRTTAPILPIPTHRETRKTQERKREIEPVAPRPALARLKIEHPRQARGTLIAPRMPPSSPLIAKMQAGAKAASAGVPPPAMPAPVQISIGRVEVRASASTSEQPRSRKPAGPRLALADYLSGRGGGGR